ncbi:MAG TPA: sulfite exporter TauE/SafE family protein [Rhizobiales bacterium]|nr:sulfite exporter TauE/SafE family protein [Hyphomicrobiales bacterium]
MDFGLPTGELVWLLVTMLAGGAAMGIFSGLLGIGGGGIMVPILYEIFSAIGVDEAIRMHLCIGTSLAIILPTSLRSFLSHKAKGVVDMDIIRSMALPVVSGVVIGVVVARYSNYTILTAIWAGAATAMSLKLFFGRASWRLGNKVPGNPGRAIYGLFIGTISTLMSIGGGAFITMMMTLYGRPIHQAVGTSSGFGPMIAIPGVLGLIWAGWGVSGLPPGSLGFVSLLSAAIIIPVSVFTAPLGVRMAHGISRRKLEIVFATFLALIALRFFWTLM